MRKKSFKKFSKVRERQTRKQPAHSDCLAFIFSSEGVWTVNLFWSLFCFYRSYFLLPLNLNETPAGHFPVDGQWRQPHWEDFSPRPNTRGRKCDVKVCLQSSAPASVDHFAVTSLLVSRELGRAGRNWDCSGCAV